LAKNITLTDTVTIASSGTTSTALTMQGGRVPLAIITPSGLTGTTFKFQASADQGANFYALYNEGTEYSVAVNTSRYIALNPNVFEGVKVLRIVSGSSEAAVRTIGIISGEL
jgi:hypothetical protein